jgi:hypothetical protein
MEAYLIFLSIVIVAYYAALSFDSYLTFKAKNSIKDKRIQSLEDRIKSLENKNN